MISKNKSSLQISMSKSSLEMLEGIVEQARQKGERVTKSQVLEAALLYFIINHQVKGEKN